jgi:antitoxin component YwqK of YwqJK toxin-antitoxin module
LKKINLHWDTALNLLDAQSFLPEILHNDTTKLRGYIEMRKQEATYRELLVEKETYRYLDSIDLTLASMGKYFPLDYPLNVLRPIKVEDGKKPPQFPPIKVWYDADWQELDGASGEFYRIGTRDSLNRWQGPVQDFYKNGKVQMKGRYLDDQQNGVFIYYSDHETYSSAGRYEKGEPVGKWEQFYSNGNLEREEYFGGSYFVKNIWDSVGNQLVYDGEGMYIKHYENGEIAIQGSFHEGKRDGYWFGNHRNGERYFEEFYTTGYLDRGRSRTRDGGTYVYDQSSFYPMPEGGNQPLLKYLEEGVKKIKPNKNGSVKITFRVSSKGVLSDFQVDKSLDEDLDSFAIELIKKGPKWIPAKQHGHQYQDGFGHVTVEF